MTDVAHWESRIAELQAEMPLLQLKLDDAKFAKEFADLQLTEAKQNLSLAVDATYGWRHIPPLPKHFEASRCGLVRSAAHDSVNEERGKLVTKRLKTRILKPHLKQLSVDGPPKPCVSVYLGDRRTRVFSVARLVAYAHLDTPFDRTDQAFLQRWRLRYKDGDVLNCAADNLEWVYSAGERGDGGVSQRRYEQNLDGWRAVDTGSVLARLYEETAA
jgi:hypothetical protein